MEIEFQEEATQRKAHEGCNYAVVLDAPTGAEGLKYA